MKEINEMNLFLNCGLTQTLCMVLMGTNTILIVQMSATVESTLLLDVPQSMR